MSNSVHRQWLRPTFRALCDPRSPSELPPTSPVQVIDVSTDGLSAHVGARFLLSDKQLKVWSLVSATSLARFQAEFPEFHPSGRSLGKLAGGIIVPTRCRVYVHPNMFEFVMQIDEFEYKGGAGNNEFAHPIFHTQDAEVQQLLHQYRNIDITPLIDRTQFDAATAAAVASSGGAISAALPSARLPFVASVRTQIDALVADPHNAHLEGDSLISAEQAEQLATIDDGFRRSGTRREAEAERAATTLGEGEGEGAPPRASEEDGFSFSQLDSFQESQGEYFSQELSAAEAHDDFSQVAPAAATSAAAASGTAAASAPGASAAAGPAQFSATQLFLRKQMRGEGEPSRPAAAPAPLSSNQAFVAAFSGVSTSFVVTAPTPAAASAAGQPQPQSAQPAHNDKSAEPGSPAKASLSFPQSQSPGRGSARSSLSPARSPARHSLSVPISPARSSLSVVDETDADANGGGGAFTQAPGPPSQESLHNLPVDSLDDPVHVVTPQADGEQPLSQPGGQAADEVEEDEAEQFAAQENEFPFLTQAHQGDSQESQDTNDDDEAEGKEKEGSEPAPMEMDSQQVASDSPAATPVVSTTPAASKRPPTGSAAHTPSPLSLRIPPTPSAGSSAVSSTTPSAKTSPHPAPFIAPAAAAAAPTTSYTASSIQQRQAARERKVQEQMEAIERERVAEQQRLQRIKDEEAAAAAAAVAAAAAQQKLQADLAAAAAEAEAEAERDRVQTAAAAAAADAQRAEADSDAMSDEEAYRLAANLAAPPTKKRARTEQLTHPIDQPASSASAAGASAASAAAPASKKLRMVGGPARRESAPVPTFIEDGVRRALQAMQAAEQKGRVTKQTKTLRFPQLPLSIVPSRARRRDTGSATGEDATTSAMSDAPSAAATAAAASAATAVPAAAAASSPSVPPSVPVVSAARPSSSFSASVLPPFGLRFPISAAEVQAAVRYFRTRRPPAGRTDDDVATTAAAAAAHKAKTANCAGASPRTAHSPASARARRPPNEESEEKEGQQPHDADDLQYSQCF